jgi:hypothetical protein
MMNDLRIGRWVKGGVGPFSRYNFSIRLEKLRRTTKNFNEDRPYCVSDSNQAPPELTVINQMMLQNVPWNWSPECHKYQIPVIHLVGLGF